MSDCKILDKCKKCRCCKQQGVGLAEKIAKHRPAERVVERQIVELATRCESGCGCNKTKKEVENANERS